VQVRDVTVRYGSSTIKLENCTDVVLDHVHVDAGSYGVEFGHDCRGTALSHCRVNGGMPPWYFRSDRKSEYLFLSDGATRLAENVLGAHTIKGLLFGAPTCTSTTITNCEFVNGHDLALFGSDLDFSRNWIHNLNDDGLFAEPEGGTNIRIFGNVVQQSLMAISMARRQAGNGLAVYRNLIDLRDPTASIRPRPFDEKNPLAHGQLFKSNAPDGPLNLFQNTVVLRDQTVESSFAHFRNYDGARARRSFNNIFVAIDSIEGSRRPITYLPSPTSLAATDGNCYFRLGPFALGELFHYRRYDFEGVSHAGGGFESLIQLKHSGFFDHSKSAYAPGFEASTIEGNPVFSSFDATTGSPAPDDDLRLAQDSPAAQAGIELPDALRMLDGAPAGQRPAIGCFVIGAPALAVGVDGRHHFP
jgi:hypothetical protein